MESQRKYTHERWIWNLNVESVQKTTTEALSSIVCCYSGQNYTMCWLISEMEAGAYFFRSFFSIFKLQTWFWCRDWSERQGSTNLSAGISCSMQSSMRHHCFVEHFLPKLSLRNAQLLRAICNFLSLGRIIEISSNRQNTFTFVAFLSCFHSSLGFIPI